LSSTPGVGAGRPVRGRRPGSSGAPGVELRPGPGNLLDHCVQATQAGGWQAWQPTGSAQRSRMPQGRRSRLIIRRFDPWTILKFSVLLYLSMYFVIVVAGIVLWLVASATGVRGNVEGFIGELIASDNFKFKANQILKSSV